MTTPPLLAASWNGYPVTLTVWGPVIPTLLSRPDLDARVAAEMRRPVEPLSGASISHWAHGTASLDLEVVMGRR